MFGFGDDDDMQPQSRLSQLGAFGWDKAETPYLDAARRMLAERRANRQANRIAGGNIYYGDSGMNRMDASPDQTDGMDSSILRRDPVAINRMRSATFGAGWSSGNRMLDSFTKTRNPFTIASRSFGL